IRRRRFEHRRARIDTARKLVKHTPFRTEPSGYRIARKRGEITQRAQPEPEQEVGKRVVAERRDWPWLEERCRRTGHHDLGRTSCAGRGEGAGGKADRPVGAGAQHVNRRVVDTLRECFVATEIARWPACWKFTTTGTFEHHARRKHFDRTSH